VVSQFYKLDKLVVEGGKSVCAATILDDSGEDANTHSRASKQEREVASFDKKILGESFSFHSSIFLTVTQMGLIGLSNVNAVRYGSYRYGENSGNRLVG